MVHHRAIGTVHNWNSTFSASSQSLRGLRTLRAELRPPRARPELAFDLGNQLHSMVTLPVPSTVTTTSVFPRYAFTRHVPLGPRPSTVIRLQPSASTAALAAPSARRASRAGGSSVPAPPTGSAAAVGGREAGSTVGTWYLRHVLERVAQPTHGDRRPSGRTALAKAVDLNTLGL